jgi:threonyl-tRNA synthetase
LPENIQLTLDGVSTSVAAGATGFELFQDKKVVAQKVNGELRDLAHKVSDEDVVEAVTIDSPDGLSILRHSTAHVLAQAVQKLNPDARLGIGPPITDGFYYDFDVAEPFTPECRPAVRGSGLERSLSWPAFTKYSNDWKWFCVD